MNGSCDMMSKCDMSKCASMTKEECAKMCDEKGCTPEEKSYCMGMYGADGKFVGAKCDMNKCMNMSKEACASYCDSMKCSPEEKEMCLRHAGMGAEKSCCKDKTTVKACITGCTHGCKTKEECIKSCGESCAKMH
jgi:K(+)-stimulated pyrophosphate-energized sodium pump